MSIKIEAQKGFTTIEPGEYEVVLQKPGVRENQWGSERLELTMLIRKDVEQPGQGRLIFHSLSRKKNPTAEDEGTDGFSYAMIQQIAGAAKLQEGAVYADLDALLRALDGSPLRVTVRNEDYQGKAYLRVKFLEPTKFPFAQPPIEDDDLPF